MRVCVLLIWQACIKAGQPDTALQVHEKLVGKGGLRADLVVRTLVVHAHAMRGDFPAAFQLITVRDDEFI